MEAPVFTGRMLKAARALAGITIAELAAASGVAVRTIKRAEAEERSLVRMTAENVARVISALEREQVIFLAETSTVGSGVIYRLPSPLLSQDDADHKNVRGEI